MKTLFYCILSLCMIQSVSAADLVVPGVDTSKGIGASDVKYNPDGSMGVGDMKYDKNGASAGNMGVDKDNARAGNLVASGGMTPELTPLKNAPTSGSASPSSAKPTVGGSVTPTSGATGTGAGKIVVGEKLPQTGPTENLIIFIACILSAVVLYRGYRKNAI
ncbi:hypothetical protein HOO68_04980 [Candidatus Gracilibacteria bacterium]|nr:hypothetical protein [Candidatus Gracilibacteria bacterium]